MLPRYIDSHAHLFYKDYDDVDSVITRAGEAGIEKIIVPGTDVGSSREAVRLADKFKCIFACVGIHPHEVVNANEKDLFEIEELSKHPKAVAIGEIGLDYHYDYSPRNAQCEYFFRQIEIAIRQKLPIVVHMRKATKDTFDIIFKSVKEFPGWNPVESEPRRGVFHCFPGTAEEAHQLYNLGFYVSFPGIVTFKKNESLNVIKQIGIQKILVETDSPYMTPVPFRGKRNEPANIIYIGRAIADALAISEIDVADVTTQNAVRLFGLNLTEDDK